MNKRIFQLVSILICLPLLLSAQKEWDDNFPKDLKRFTLLVERISLDFLQKEFRSRDSLTIVEEFKRVNMIQNLYLEKEPSFPCLLVNSAEIESTHQTMREKYKYVLKYKVVDKKVGKKRQQVLTFYFQNLTQGTDFKMLEDHNFDTKITLVLIYGLIRKAYDLPNG